MMSYLVSVSCSLVQSAYNHSYLIMLIPVVQLRMLVCGAVQVMCLLTCAIVVGTPIPTLLAQRVLSTSINNDR